ncbi:anti-sigma regulatory factor, serine/threonine protein kinase [Planomonospora sphaerica]|uniref:Anti-sigma regulatory factor, serine/threonine protein kinase n=1 Tax=Planomonospora sphaerica TaxID=161355 RepID=A0A161LM92_9ACTN|nr:anti-sigma regulatory factor, serine/threonine protein kinase [Planomonospora sphaerica]
MSAPQRVRPEESGGVGGTRRSGETSRTRKPCEARHAVLEVLRRREFPGVPSSVAEARAWARDLLTEQVSGDTLDVALLLLSEVFTNSVVHSDSGRVPGGTVTVYLGALDGLAHVEVIDDGAATTMPFLRAATPDGENGRGLALVDLLAAKWSVHHDEETGTAVWFQVCEETAI